MTGRTDRGQREATRSAMKGIIMKKEDWAEFSSVANITFHARKCEELLEFLMNKFYIDELYKDATNLDDILNDPTGVEHAAQFAKIIQYARAKPDVTDAVLDDDLLRYEYLRKIVNNCAKEVQDECQNGTPDHKFLKNIIKPDMPNEQMRKLSDRPAEKKTAIDKRRYENMKTDRQRAIAEKLLLLVSRELFTAETKLSLGSCIYSVFLKSRQQQEKKKPRFERTAYIVEWLNKNGIPQETAKDLYHSFDKIRELRMCAHFVGHSYDQEMEDKTRESTAKFERILESGLYGLIFNDTRPLQVCFSMLHSIVDF